MLATLPGRTQGLGLATESLLADLKLDRVLYADQNFWATILGAAACLPMGWAIDRLGLKWVTTAVVLGLGLTVWRMAGADSNPVALFGLLLATRALGQSALSVCSVTTVGRWFPQRAGMAMGVYSVLLSVFFVVGFVAVGAWIQTGGWRVAWSRIAVALVFVVAPLALLGLRQPRVGAGLDRPATADGEAPGTPFAAAIRTPAFWFFAMAGAAFNFASSGLGLFGEAVFAENGFDQSSYHAFLAVSTLMSLVGQFACGWLASRRGHRVPTRVALAVYAAGLAMVPMVHARWQLWIVAVLVGVAGGAVIVVFFSIWSETFGQRHLGRIQGAAQMLTVLSSGLGPVVFARSHAATGSYGPLLWVLAAAVLVLGLSARRRFFEERLPAVGGTPVGA